ncbi:DUF1864 family protein [Bacillus sonorensis]|uniref:Uncharacterized protein n=2 Tax=Bacillus sonorensis TaxID=119858 RepID=M5PHN4_9BACI|nr:MULTISPECIES: monodechloroaminopyrrolnitrin synthase PrnB family protein [Bacillus]TWK82290.1 Monodechloroaminopyrrolnitrin synthase PrnB [Bacillus paralicheniformis]ASB88951.1 hypothetical protein S101395_02444 [Bacillus sonorensis]EME76242.1 hypothetical protein BSONL12_00617 [Bacillus sonorensis L12]MBG9915277.1 hypothetical protein [Bacillus sonorensis]MCF7618299.1 DUF1864 family protein [Bacillus sonorensis]
MASSEMTGSCEKALYPFGEFSRFVVHELPGYQQKEEYAEGVSALLHLMPSFDEVLDIVYGQPFAVRIRAIGDLGIFLVASELGQSSASRDIISRLKMLAASVGMAPRDTYSSYVNYNPKEALRTFTGDESEVNFIRQLQKSDEAIRPAAEKLLLLKKNPFHENRINFLEEAASCVRMLKHESRTVHQTVDPAFFFHCFRRYFFPIQIGGREYSAPSAVHLANLIIIDIVTGTASESHLQMIQTLFPYFEPKHKVNIAQAMSTPSLKDSYLKANDIEELSLLDEIYQSIIEYRLTHQGIVNRYIRKQDPDVKYGTGGFPFDSFLQELIDMVEVSRKDINDFVKK